MLAKNSWAPRSRHVLPALFRHVLPALQTTTGFNDWITDQLAAKGTFIGFKQITMNECASFP